MVRLGYVVRRHRERLQFSQEGFADHIGVHRTYYGNIERSKQNPTLWNLQRIALGLRISLSDLLAEAEALDLERAVREPPAPPRRGRPPGSKSR
ncbi:helix-turn-helix domain-containing protein [Dokdonella ginsengisoli]|uniref:helix-turn-helix domain-containing protein n=1 Tax=Dokdonella ginsengisoli TaxID=363846 RepID=UPI0036D3BCE5